MSISSIDLDEAIGVTAVRSRPTGSQTNNKPHQTSLINQNRTKATQQATHKIGHYPRRFGDYGGQYTPESLITGLSELEAAFFRETQDFTFWDEYRSHYDFIGRPGRLQLADHLTAIVGGARIWLLREDLNHTGSLAILNALGQVLLARRMGKKNIVTETGSGLNGVAVASVCAKFAMPCTVFVGANDIARQLFNMRKISLLGARIVVVDREGRGFRDAMTEAFRACAAEDNATYHLAGSPMGPHPIPSIVRCFQSAMGRDARTLALQKLERLPDAVVACVGSGSCATGLFPAFMGDASVKLLGIEAAGYGLQTGQHAAPLDKGRRGVFHGAMTYVLQDDYGQILQAHSVAAGLEYPAVGPEVSFWKDSSQVEFSSATDEDALRCFHLLSRLEGIIPSLESAHAIHGAIELAKSMACTQDVLVCISGSGDKDVQRADIVRFPNEANLRDIENVTSLM